jgi:hypothetical protein
MILGGRGGNEKSVGLKPGLDNFAPRLGGIFRLNEHTVLRSGYGITYNAMGWARPMRGDLNYPIVVFSSFTQPLQFGYYNLLHEGIPLILPPDESSGRVVLPNAAGVATPEPGNVDRGMVQTWNVAFERRLLWNTTVDVAYVGAKGTGGYAWVDINLPTTYGGGAASRPYFISFKGAYTLSKAMNESDNDGRTGLTWEHPLEQHLNWALAGFDRTHNFQLGFAYALPWQNEGGYSTAYSARSAARRSP